MDDEPQTENEAEDLRWLKSLGAEVVKAATLEADMHDAATVGSARTGAAAQAGAARAVRRCRLTSG